MPQNHPHLSKVKLHQNDLNIFTWLEDWRGLAQTHDYPSSQQIIAQGETLLSTQAYSDINVQDEKGNTFLHYATEHAQPELMMKILRLGANPYIQNKKDRNAFQVSREYGFMHRFWQSIEQSNLVYFTHFKNQALDFHPAFRSTLFDLIINTQFIFEKTIEQQLDYLKNIDLNCAKHQIGLLFLPHNSITQAHFDYLLDMNRTMDDNAHFLYRFSKNILSRQYGVQFQRELEIFCDQSPITFSTSESYEYLTEILRNSFFTKNLSKNYTSTLFLRKIFQTMIEEKASEQDERLDGILNLLFSEQPEIHAFYLEQKLSKKADKKNHHKI